MTREWVEERIHAAEVALEEYERNGETVLADIARQRIASLMTLRGLVPEQRDPED